MDGNNGGRRKDGAKETRVEALEKRLELVKVFKTVVVSMRVALIVLGALALLTGLILVLIDDVSIDITIAIIFIGAILTAYGIIFQGRELDNKIQGIKLELDLERVDVKPMEERSERLFQRHQIELKRYYDQILNQNAWVFFTGLVCIAFGFAIIGSTVYFVFIKPPSSLDQIDLSVKIVAACLGAVGGILSNFIAFIYLNMFSKTLSSLTKFHNRLVATHYLHFGNFLVSKIEDVDLREKTLAAIASKLGMLQDLTAEEPSGDAELIKPKPPK
jgi:hypothetical protein